MSPAPPTPTPGAADDGGVVRRIVAHMADGVVIVDADDTIRFANPAAETLFGRPAAALVGSPFGFPLAADPDAAGEDLEIDVVPPTVGSGREPVEPRVAELRVVEMPWDGVPMRLVSLRDVTDRKLAEAHERQLADAEAARAKAEAANELKTEFLAMMSHELRTPLNAIGGYAELLALGIRGPITDAQEADLARIQASQQHLLGLVNELLDLTRLESGVAVVGHDPASVAHTVEVALTLVRPQVEEKGLALATGPADGAGDAWYLGDEPRVRQILVNLLANAVKFTPAGGEIAVTWDAASVPPAGARAGSHAKDGACVVLRVADTGVGIAAEQHERIFEPFTQGAGGDNPYTRPAGGAGLGLAISRRFARLMGGDLTVESRAGGGSAFTLWLPQAGVAPAGVAPAGAAPAAAAPAVAAPESDGAEAGSPGAGSAGSGAVSHAPWTTDLDGDRDAGAPAGDGAHVEDALARLGDMLLGEVTAILHTWTARLRDDPLVPVVSPQGTPYTDVQLEDHAATFVTDLALALRTVARGGADTASLLRDGAVILATVAERHGAQRARLGWPAAALPRELALLREILDTRVTTATTAPGGPPMPPQTVARARVIIGQLFADAERRGLAGFRVGAGEDERARVG